MKIRYTFVNGDTTEVEVSEEIGAVIVESRHQEALNDRKESRRHYHYDADDVYEGEEYGADDPSLLALFTTDAQDKIAYAMASLTDSQREVISALYLEGLLAKEYAAKKDISEAAVSKAKKTALEKMKRVLLEYEVLERCG